MKRFGIRFTSLAIAAVMVGSIFAGCAGAKKDSKTAAPSASGTQQAKKVDFPKGDVTFIIPNAPGGGNDLTVRSIIPGLEKALKAKVVPENKPASRGAVAFMDIANAKPDGQKLYFNSMTALQLQYSGVPEAKIEKMVPIAQMAEDAAVFYVRPDSEWKTFNDLVNHLKTTKTKVKTANTGLGALWHVVEVVFSKAIGADSFHYISFPSGSTQMLTALVSGEVDLVVCGPAEAKAFTDAGKVKALAVMTDKRFPSIPDVKTCREQGVDIDYPIWRGIFTTAGTDEAILQILSDAAKTASESEEFKKYASVGMAVSFKDYKEFKKVVDKENERLAKVMPEIMEAVKKAEEAAPKK